jgi:hypothetical protein
MMTYRSEIVAFSEPHNASRTQFLASVWITAHLPDQGSPYIIAPPSAR